MKIFTNGNMEEEQLIKFPFISCTQRMNDESQSDAVAHARAMTQIIVTLEIYVVIFCLFLQNTHEHEYLNFFSTTDDSASC